MGTMAANWKKRGIRYVAVFWQLFERASARLNMLRMPNIGVSEIKNNMSQPLFVLWDTFNSSMSRVIGRCRRAD